MPVLELLNVSLRMEIWKLIPGTNDKYEASSKGNIRRIISYVSNGSGGKRLVGGKILKVISKYNSYQKFRVSLNPSETKMMYVHRAVASAFIGIIPKGLVINHKDGNKHNNQFENLEIVTYTQNAKHAYNTGLANSPSGLDANLEPIWGSKNGMSIFKEDDIIKIRKQYDSGVPIKEIWAGMSNCSQSTIEKICYRSTWKHV